MPFTYEKDDQKRRVLVTVEGPFAMTEALEAITRHGIENTWEYGILYDLRRLSGAPTSSDLREIMKEQSAASGGRRGPVAFLVTDSNLYSRACAYKVIAPSHLKIEVFRNRNEAETWLSEQTS